MKTPMHYADKYLLNPTNPITVTLIGAGGTGSFMIANLARMNHCMIALGHPGLQVSLWDDDVVTEANRGRQLFTASEIGLNKAVARINNINRSYGTNWKAIEDKLTYNAKVEISDEARTNIYISCVDSVNARFDIGSMMKDLKRYNSFQRDKPMYWLDLGNSKHTGQGILSTICDVSQPKSKLYMPVGKLPMITEEFKGLLEREALTEHIEPSCSTAEALEKQDLFINPEIANKGASLLWQIFRNGMTENRGFFMNLNTFQCSSLKVA